MWLLRFVILQLKLHARFIPSATRPPRSRPAGSPLPRPRPQRAVQHGKLPAPSTAARRRRRPSASPGPRFVLELSSHACTPRRGMWAQRALVGGRALAARSFCVEAALLLFTTYRARLAAVPSLHQWNSGGTTYSTSAEWHIYTPSSFSDGAVMVQ